MTRGKYDKVSARWGATIRSSWASSETVKDPRSPDAAQRRRLGAISCNLLQSTSSFDKQTGERGCEFDKQTGDVLRSSVDIRVPTNKLANRDVSCGIEARIFDESCIFVITAHGVQSATPSKKCLRPSSCFSTMQLATIARASEGDAVNSYFIFCFYALCVFCACVRALVCVRVRLCACRIATPVSRT